ncbi:MAG: DNA-3-methyladenine glycosylase [Candidatus Bathyarchaeota archaeon]
MTLVLKQGFYARDPADVARALLGKTLVRRLGSERLEGVIVETEAYYGEGDPASRAFKGRKSYNKVMWGEPGRLFVYNVHRYWMLNFIAHRPGGVGGVLIRAIEPTTGIERMLVNRPVDKMAKLTSGPGKLSVALAIGKSLNGSKATDEKSPIHALHSDSEPETASSHRIGVTRDLPENLRFYVKNSGFVSR